MKKEKEISYVEQNPCACCTTGPVIHWRCSLCGQGPFVFRRTRNAGGTPRDPWFTGLFKYTDDSGAVPPRPLYCCSRDCYGQYEERRLAGALAAERRWLNVGQVSERGAGEKPVA